VISDHARQFNASFHKPRRRQEGEQRPDLENRFGNKPWKIAANAKN
jgi:hypothetical protein